MSYTQVDRAWAEWVAWELEDDGYRVLIQAWDMVVGANWVNSMQEGVQHAARTIALLSPEYVSSTYGTAEWQATWRDDPLGEQRKLVVLRVAECERPGLLGPIVSADLFGLTEAQARSELRRVIEQVVTGRGKPARQPLFPGPGRVRAVEVASLFPGALPQVWNIPPRNPNFTGRSDLLEYLHRQLRGDRPVAVHSLQGMGGVGKTQLAIEYAHRYARDYELAWRIPAEQPELIPHHLAQLADAVGLRVQDDRTQAVEQVLGVLRSRTRWLLVFDNAEDPAALLPFLPGSTGHVLITTRRTGFASMGGVLEVDVLERGESLALLHRRIPSLTDNQGQRLAELLGDLPLALEQAAAYLDTTALPAGEYVALVQQRGGDMLGKGRAVGYEHTLTTVWTLALDRVRKQRPAARELLGLCAYLAPEAIPLDLFTTHPEQLPPALAAAVHDPLEWADTLGILVDYSLARRSEYTISLHRLLQITLRHHDIATSAEIPDPDSQAIVMKLLCVDLPGTITSAPQDWPRWQQLLPHVLATTTYRDNTTALTNPQASAWLLNGAATYLQVLGQPASARPLYERGLRITETTYGPEHPKIAPILNNLARVLSDLGKPDQAQPLYERGLRITETTYGPEHPEIALILNNLAGVLSDLGKPDQAEPLLERALRITETTYGPEHPELAITLNNLAGVLSDLGKPDQAQPLYERGLRITETVYGPEHPEIATTLNNLALVLSDLGRPDQAQPLVERALYITETVYGPEHPEIATTLNNLALVLSDRCKPDQAQPLLERALRITEASYGPEHPTVSTRLNNLALALGDLGKPDQAQPLLERALRITETTYGPEHPELATTLNNLALALHALGKPDRAQPLLERALRITEASYGPEHPTVSTRLNNLASALSDQCKPDQAQPLLERALRITEASYGPEHPTVSTRLNNLALALGDLGKPDQARPLLERALCIDEAVYGPDYPEIATTLNNLASVLSALGKPDQARLLLERALRVTGTAYGPEHPKVALTLNNLASVLSALGKPSPD